MDRVTHEKLEEICERAAEYRRMVIAGGRREDITQALRETVRAFPVRPEPRSDGWYYVGQLPDTESPWTLKVHWHAETDTVRLERPKPIPPAKSHVLHPLRQWIHSPYVIADEGYVYVYAGVDHTPEQAIKAITDRGPDPRRLGIIAYDLTGWTWRKLDDV